ncbi:uncharacterized protein CTHT_0058970 [Thermochaetoides thermophila DSM 1495]|uniref:Rhodopsin family protein n=1 Tax=Chaetomium thermophilum (strain DSM 1495 / CBS 144.50 / IMI 039719) TaxID=759272 RepID=G0SD00_CHATD|nr:hypothetical protein CTHT_0058970 [Thermochaetoides thermophila DSM 1495]EGS19271.1 hypothetical protein CTHT_0058970 [Thermochaetoides thermophila DSM 1495]
MCIVFTCGEHTFRKQVEGYEGLVCRCYNCGNYAASVVRSHPWFTFCFIPVLPLSIKGYEDVSCRICGFEQPLSHRPDVQAMRGGAAASGAVPGQAMPMHPPPMGPPQGWGYGGPPPKPDQMRYG